MSIHQLKSRLDLGSDEKLLKVYTQFETLLSELGRRPLTPAVEKVINDSVDEVNTSTHTGSKLASLIRKKQSAIIKKVEKELKLVPKNYYRTLWMIFGFSAFGLPIGTAVGLLLGNIGLLGIGLPFGMLIGLAVGTRMDKKAASENRQLDVEIKN